MDTTNRRHLGCILKRTVPVELARHDERAVGIAGVVVGAGVDILSQDNFSSR